MWWAGSESVDAFLGASTLGVVSGTEDPRWADVGSAVDGANLLMKQLGERRASSGGRKQRVRIWLSGSLARPFLLPVTPGLRSASDALKVAESLCHEQTGLAAECRVWLDDWVDGKACLAVAVEQALVEAVETQARQASVAIRSMRPWWALTLAEVLKMPSVPAMLAVDDGEALTIVGGEGEEFSVAAGYARPDREQAKATAVRAAFAGNLVGKPSALVTRSATQAPAQSDPGSPLPIVFGAIVETLA